MGRVPGYMDLFDGIAQEAIWFDGGGDPDAEEQISDVRIDTDQTAEYLDDLQVWLDAGLPVFNVEYAIEPEHVSEAYELSSEQGYVPYVTTRPLAQLTEAQPPGY
jgi:endo-alpha-1,4-polygalactosaminidase (GH114 family)